MLSQYREIRVTVAKQEQKMNMMYNMAAISNHSQLPDNDLRSHFNETLEFLLR